MLNMPRYSILFALLGVVSFACSQASEGSAEQTGTQQSNLENCVFAPQEWASLNRLSPLPEQPPLDTTNKYADRKAAAVLGQKLFFDKRIAGPIQQGSAAEGQLGAVGERYKIACADCHMPASGWLFDIRSNNGGRIPNATALGSAWMTRNVSSIVNTVYYVLGKGRNAPHWRENDGYSDSEWFDAQSEPEGAPVQNGSRLQLAHLIFEHYHAEYTAAFPDWPLDPGLANYARFPATGSPSTDVSNWNSLSPADQGIINRILANYGKAIEAYLRKLISRNAPFDRFMAGNSHAISEQAQRGAKLFVGKARCVSCHNTPQFSDDDFHVIGLQVDTLASPHADPNEIGRAANQSLICDSEFNVNGPYSDDRNTTRLAGFCGRTIKPGLWRTKSLRHVAETAPYMRTGQFATLDEVIEFYDRGGDAPGTYLGGPKEIQPLHLSAQEKADLKQFLLSLTGERIHSDLIRDLHNP